VRTLVTGASGFIGRRVLASLQDRFENVAAFASDLDDLTRREQPADVVLHLAAVVRREQFAASPQRGYDVNVIGTQSVLNYCRRVGARCVVASTSAVYRPSATPLGENDPTEPASPYAMSKWLAERLCERHATDAGVPVTALRLFNVYGPGQHEDFLIPYVVRTLTAKQPLGLRMPQAVRDFVYVDDVVAAFERAAVRAHSGFHVFNIGSGCATAVHEMVRVAERVFGPASHIETSGGHERELQSVVADIAKARRELDWSPRYDLAAGLQAMKAATAR